MFGERFPRIAYSETNRFTDDAGVFLSPGSSLTVHPATGLAGRAVEVGSLVVVNFDVAQYDNRIGRVVRGDSVAFLPEVEKRVWA